MISTSYPGDSLYYSGDSLYYPGDSLDYSGIVYAILGMISPGDSLACETLSLGSG